ncbi:MAG: hypothetical protein K2K41_02410, partial [Ruminiclostridium sp.]|nr:hypothetical protein [Ruminiclostridium sp.]
MISAKKAIIGIACILMAISLCACSQKSEPEFDYSGIKEVDKDELFSKATEEQPKDTETDTVTISNTTENEPITVITTEEETLSEEAPPAPAETEQQDQPIVTD